jgi:hypothetical protein
MMVVLYVLGTGLALVFILGSKIMLLLNYLHYSTQNIVKSVNITCSKDSFETVSVQISVNI